MNCPKCNSTNIIKNGTKNGGQQYICKNCDHHFYIKKVDNCTIISDKQSSEIHWRDLTDLMKHRQQISKKASYTQDYAHITIKTDKPICVVNICDWHFGANGTDYSLVEKITDEILSTPDLYIVLTGDMLETAITMRNVKEMVNQLEPEHQIAFLESWLEDVKHKVLAATWDNHTVSREEKQTGFSIYKRIIGHEKQIIYHNGIGYVDLTVGKITYKFVLSHKFIGNSYLNPTHSQQRYMRFESQDREIAMSGHTHKPAFSWYHDGQYERLAINGGTLHTSSEYSKRYFSLFSIPIFPCVVLSPDKKSFIPYKSLGAWRDR